MASRRGASASGARSAAVLLALVVAACSVDPAALPSASAAPGAASTPWQSAAPESQGFDSVVLADALPRLRATASGLHALVVVRGGSVVLDAAFYPYDGTDPHHIGAITRVVVTTLLGIAIERGVVELDDPVLSFFPDRAIAHRDDRKEGLTLRHLASMTTGFECTAAEDEATLRAMMASPDWVGFALDLPMSAEPGTTFRACGPATHLLSAALEVATGVPTADYARQFLFEPLGISVVRWGADPGGTTAGFGELYLLPRDLARIGQLWLAGGVWAGRQVVPAAWVAAATRSQVPTGGHDGYGFGWWLPGEHEGGGLEASGRGGQQLIVRPDVGLVIVTAGSGADPVPAVEAVLGALVAPEAPLLSDPFGVTALGEATLAAASPPPPATPRSSELVAAIAGVTWALEDSPLALTTLRLDLRGRDREGTVRMTYRDTTVAATLPVGLDGRFRIGLDGHRRPVAARGRWRDGRVFVLEVDEITSGRGYTLTLRPGEQGRTLVIDGREWGRDAGFVQRVAPAS
jgi:CubicO group peptidase (beta-lactamase class C family)